MIQNIHYNQLNEAMSCRRSEKNPEQYMAGTMFVGSDRYPIVVVEVVNNKKIKISPIYDDDYNNHIYEKNGNQYIKEDYMQKYNGNTTTYTYRKNNRWMPMGQSMWGTCSIHLGYADSYLDPSF